METNAQNAQNSATRQTPLTTGLAHNDYSATPIGSLPDGQAARALGISCAPNATDASLQSYDDMLRRMLGRPPSHIKTPRQVLGWNIDKKRAESSKLLAEATEMEILRDSLPEIMVPEAEKLLARAVAFLAIMICLFFCLRASAQVASNKATTNVQGTLVINATNVSPATIDEEGNALVEKVRKRDGTNYIGVFMGMIAEHDGVGGVSMSSATSGELLRWIPFAEFNDVYVLKIKPEYPASIGTNPPLTINIAPTATTKAQDHMMIYVAGTNSDEVSLTEWLTLENRNSKLLSELKVGDILTNTVALVSKHEPVVVKGTNGAWTISFPDVVKPEERGVTAGEAAATSGMMFKQGAVYGALVKMRNPDVDDGQAIIALAEKLFKAQVK